MLRSVREAAQSAPSIEDALRAALQGICAHAGWSAGRALLANGKGMRSLWHVETRSRLGGLRQLLAARRGGGESDLAARVLREGKPVRHMASANESFSIFAFPAVARGRSIAALEFFAEGSEAPEPALIDAVAHACAELGEAAESKPSEEALRRMERGYRDLFETLPEALLLADPATRTVLDANPRACELYAVSRAAMLGTSLGALLGEEEVASSLLERSRVLQTRVRRADGSTAVVEVTSSLAEYLGHPAALLLSREVTRTMEVLDALRASEERYRVLFENNPQPMWVEDLRAGRFLAVNEAAVRHYGWPRRVFLEMRSSELRADGNTHGDLRVGNLVERHRTASGEPRDVELAAHEISFEGHAALLVAATDVTARRRAQARLLQAAFYDPLTGLPNRALFKDRLEVAFSRAKGRDALRFAVLFLDLDRFKLVNDSLGHRAGDELLVQIARRLESCARAGDTVARLGGDEFTLLVENVLDHDDAIAVAERVHRALAPPFLVEGHEVFSPCSIGIALGGPLAERPEHLLRDADTAMYRAKLRGTRHAVFDASMHERAMTSLRMENDLRRAIERGELRCHYQPIVDLKAGRVLGFEALVRWEHRERGLVPPTEFIALAEETGLIVPLGRWVLQEACAAGRELPDDLTVSVNLSGRQLLQPGFVAELSEMLAGSGLSPRRLRLELTESMLIGNGAAAMEVLERVRDLGVRLCIDDFGTGYSSLSYLHELPIEALKIDRSFVQALGEDPRKIKIVQSILLLGVALGIEVVAEGVETPAQADALRRLGCERAQGYLFARPGPIADPGVPPAS